eukprot:446528-Pelagomonas_calceolata.AAC.1
MTSSDLKPNRCEFKQKATDAHSYKEGSYAACVHKLLKCTLNDPNGYNGEKCNNPKVDSESKQWRKVCHKHLFKTCVWPTTPG